MAARPIVCWLFLVSLVSGAPLRLSGKAAARLLAAAAGLPTPASERLKYTNAERFTSLGDLIVGGSRQTSVCLCTKSGLSGTSATQDCVNLAAVCPTLGGANHSLPVSLANGHQGYWYEGLKPALLVASGDTIDVEMVAANVNAYDEMVVGDPALEKLFAWGPTGPAIVTEGALGGGEGNHWLSGPIYVCDAEPGDVLQVDVLELKPRPNPGKGGRAYGWTGSAWWGYPWAVGFKTGQPREVITVLEVELDSQGRAIQGLPLYSFNLKNLDISTSCVAAAAEFPCTTPEGAAAWNNSGRVYGDPQRLLGSATQEYTVPCEGGQQDWNHLVYVGWPFEVPEEARDYSVKGAFHVPTSLHIGNIGLAPAVGVTVTSAVPMRTGGNMDQKHLTAGASMYFPIEVYGALLSLGDGHGAMGDGEIEGTGLEMSMNARIRVTLHKKDSLPAILKGLGFPLLENANEYVLQGFSFQDYLRQVEYPQAKVGALATLDRALQTAFNITRDFFMSGFNLTEDAALAAISLGVNFGDTQVVDGNLGVHSIVPKFVVDPALPAPYAPQVWAGTSVPISEPAAVAY